MYIDKRLSANRIELHPTIAWRSARAVDWSGLENRRTCERTVGSNPTSSSILKEPQKALF